MYSIESWTRPPLLSTIDLFADLLQDAVEHGASVGFLSPFSREEAVAYWREVGDAVDAGNTILLAVTTEDGDIVGSAQLTLCKKPNGNHRAEIQKVLVRSDHRRKGLGRRLMETLETTAKLHGIRLLVLDTSTGQIAEQMYEVMGYTRVGTIPDYATMPDGTPNPTTLFYKQLT